MQLHGSNTLYLDVTFRVKSFSALRHRPHDARTALN